ncbi:MAG: hypothetical protein COV31_00490 [Candidatus Yanofskybacteria bacterium CG10_big_fil_rev_8_21_14_0_10_46_23]|uniref:Uncharacterized protein n=1 Tax=Candidatus Yanofskybacteria bacterium CG10_big_fil_rev_8_21_14_0_10_46_23 TaxID=1975098 RepID=A0A2H0R6B9_9BACT|nr:MAG: hypothetical protein COV31_00490 [Candidatus Yanofskybacteria bacterium CG10_big_fil_rev_8_21_14_0_10_46_23]
MKKILSSVVIFSFFAFALTAVAVSDPMLYGGAFNDTGVVVLPSDLSDSSPDNDFSGINWTDIGLNFEELTYLGTDYNITDDDCAGGAPRFQIKVNNKNVFVYIGPHPNFTGCTAGWQSTGNLIASPDARFDLTQLGGAFYSTHADALALLSGQAVQSIQLTADAGWAFADQEQTIWVNNVMINDTQFDFTLIGPPVNVNDCKKDGWMMFNNPSFDNQGKCISYVIKNKVNQRIQDIFNKIFEL